MLLFFEDRKRTQVDAASPQGTHGGSLKHTKAALQVVSKKIARIYKFMLRCDKELRKILADYRASLAADMAALSVV